MAPLLEGGGAPLLHLLHHLPAPPLRLRPPHLRALLGGLGGALQLGGGQGGAHPLGVLGAHLLGEGARTVQARCMLVRGSVPA